MDPLRPSKALQSDFCESDPASSVSAHSSAAPSRRIYGPIPHLPGSLLTSDDRLAKPWQVRVCCEKGRDDKDHIVVQEKLDGSCMAVTKLHGEIIPLARSGNRAAVSRHAQHRFFHKWVYANLERFDELLAEGEACVGEWLMQAHGTRYVLPHEPFVIFDLKSGGKFLASGVLKERAARLNFTTPRIIHEGSPSAMEKIVEQLEPSGHGAIDPVEGAVWRVERDGQLDFLAK